MQGLTTQQLSGFVTLNLSDVYPDSKVHGANMGPIWGRQGPVGPHVGPMNFSFWVIDAQL